MFNTVCCCQILKLKIRIKFDREKNSKLLYLPIGTYNIQKIERKHLIRLKKNTENIRDPREKIREKKKKTVYQKRRRRERVKQHATKKNQKNLNSRKKSYHIK